MFMCLHTFEQSCIRAYSRRTLLTHNIPLPSAEKGSHKEKERTFTGCKRIWKCFKQENGTVFNQENHLDGLFPTGKFVEFALASHLVLSDLVLGGVFSLALSPQLLQVCLGALQGVLFHFVFRLITLECGLFDRWTAERSEFIWVANLRSAGMTIGPSLGVCVGRWRSLSHTHIHVFNVHLCLLLQLNNHFFVKLLELSEEREKKSKQNKTKLKFIAHCSSTAESHDSIRKEWSAAMLDNGFLRG